MYYFLVPASRFTEAGVCVLVCVCACARVYVS